MPGIALHTAGQPRCHEWPPEALQAIAKQFLSQDKELDFSEEITGKVVKIMVEMQVAVFTLTERFLLEAKRHFYVAPASYLELISSFINTLKSRRDMVQKAKWRYETDHEKINQAKEQVGTLQVELNELEPVLEKAAQETGAGRSARPSRPPPSSTASWRATTWRCSSSCRAGRSQSSPSCWRARPACRVSACRPVQQAPGSRAEPGRGGPTPSSQTLEGEVTATVLSGGGHGVSSCMR